MLRHHFIHSPELYPAEADCLPSQWNPELRYKNQAVPPTSAYAGWGRAKVETGHTLPLLWQTAAIPHRGLHNFRVIRISIIKA
jgi:hypothetical protein